MKFEKNRENFQTFLTVFETFVLHVSALKNVLACIVYRNFHYLRNTSRPLMLQKIYLRQLDPYVHEQFPQLSKRKGLTVVYNILLILFRFRENFCLPTFYSYPNLLFKKVSLCFRIYFYHTNPSLYKI